MRKAPWHKDLNLFKMMVQESDPVRHNFFFNPSSLPPISQGAVSVA